MMVTHERPDGGFVHTQIEHDGVVYCAHIGSMEIEDAERLCEAFEDFRTRLDGRYLCCLDVTDFESASAEARKHVIDHVLGEDSPFSRLATVGGSFVARNITGMYARVALIPMRHFEEKDEAVAWLKEAAVKGEITMNEELEQYKKTMEHRVDELLNHLSRLCFASRYDWDIPIPEEGTPLADVFLTVKLAAENLELIASEREKALEDLRGKVKVIESQSVAIRELSTPVIEAWEGILILPLIGTVDTQRAQQVIDNLLATIARTQASVAIIDITGVPVVDTRVADHFVKTIQAARMLGAEVILTGVTPHNAQTLVKLGIDLARFTTKSSLQAGLKMAFQLTNHKVGKVVPERRVQG